LDEIIAKKKPAQQPPSPNQNVTADQIDAVRDGLTLTSDAELQTLLKGIFSDTANRTELLKHPKSVTDDLKNLVEKVDQAYKNGKDVAKTDLTAYSESTDATKKAL